MSLNDLVHVNVGGFPYCLAVSDIERYPDSFFTSMIKKEWLPEGDQAITIARDGALFRFVNAFLVNGNLPRDKQGQIALDEDTLARLQEEADFYGLEALVKECKIHRKRGEGPDLESYMTIRKFLKAGGFSYKNKSKMQIEYTSELIHLLKAVWSPFCSRGDGGGSIAFYCKTKLIGSSTVREINVQELIAAATQSPFGRGTETVFDTSVRNSFEIEAAKLDPAALKEVLEHIDLLDFAPHLELDIRPYKLVIYKEGGHFHEHRDTVRGGGHIGTLVVILKSDYTGGELVVSHNGRTETVTGAYSWVAMYGDCLHKINPVTSGTRVSLIYDIYGTPRSSTAVRRAVEEAKMDVDEEQDEDTEDEENASGNEGEGGDNEEPATAKKFWRDQEEHYRNKVNDEVRGVDEAHREGIIRCVESDLQSVASLIITLQHLYPECQTSPAFLKGGDRALYDLLSEQFDVQVVAATIYRTQDPEYTEFNSTKAMLFSPSIVKRVLNLPGDADEEESVPEPVAAVNENTKLLIPIHLDSESVLDYSPYIEYTGNESQSEETVYIVAGLQVRKRE